MDHSRRITAFREMHELRYMRFIGDRDNSVHSDIYTKAPEMGYDGTGIECAK